jgi:hypothetical protein
MNNKNDSVEVFSGDLYQATLVKDLLESKGIEAFIENELMGNIAPWYASSGGITPETVKIFSSDYGVAKELIDALTKWE